MKEKRRNFVREEFQLLNEGEREKCLRYWDIVIVIEEKYLCSCVF